MTGRAGLVALVVVGLMASVLTLSPPGEAAAQVEPVSVVLEGTARDFREGVPWDFQSAPISNDRGIVKADLGADSKPVYAYEPPARSVTTSGRENFDVWYRDTPGINVSIPVPIELARVPGSNPAVYRYSNGSFFPVDNQGFGNQGRGHNYSFTYELHTQFVYQGGEAFRFTGDDDVFVFINGSLAIDLGGIHGAQSATVDLDTFAASHGMVAGEQYRLDLFFAERRTSASSFSIETGLLLEDLPPLTADAGTDQVVAEGSTVSLAGSASVSPRGAPVSWAWEVIAADGPPIQLSSTAAEDPSFAVFDDGTYRLRLTATDGVETASDETTVTVTNQNPVISAVESDAAATDGLVQITTTYSDPGPFDTHHLSIDWGDGTPTETVPVQAGGTGWGYGYAGHRYAALGTPTVTVTVVDDNGGTSAPQQVTVDVGGAGQGEPNPAQPAALFAASTADSEAIRVSGSGNAVTGLSHSNAGIRVSGSGHAFVGGTEYATTLTVQGSGSTFDPAAVRAPAGGFPFEFVWADYQPGGRAATAAGAAYQQIPSSDCKGGKWKPKNPLAAGLYMVPCGVQITGSDVAGNVTIVAGGDIKVSGSGDSFVPFIDGLLFYSTATGSRAVDLSGSGHSFEGAMFAPTGGIEVTGSGNTLGCGIMGQTARISGSNNQIAGVDCRGTGGGEGTTVSIAAPPIVVPALDLTLAADKATALPGETITYTNTLRNGLADPAAPGSTTLLIPALVGVDNHDTAPVTVGDVVYTFEVHDTVTGEWRTWASTDPAAPAEQRHVTLTGRPTPTAGVAYAPDGYAGTVVDPGAIASWASAATVRLTGDQTAAILDPARVDAVRNTITIATDRPLVRKITRFDDDPLGAIRTPPAADTTDNTIALTRPAGDPVTFDTAAVPELAALTPGASATGTATAEVPQPEPAAAGETDAAYLVRLDAADGQALFGAAYGTGTARVGGLFANQQLAATSVQVPIVTADLAAPTQIAAGSDIPISLTLINTGSTTATDIAAVVDVAGHGTLTLTGLPDELAPGATATGTTSISTTAGTTATYATTATIGWSHPGGTPGLYGPLHPTATTVAKPPVALDVVKYDNAEIIEDGIDYVIVATNTGANPLTGITVVDPIDANATLIAGTATTTTGTVTAGTDPADRTVTVDIGTLNPGAQAVIGFQVDYTLAPPTASVVVNQATVTTAELGDVPSDDPSEPGTADANVTPITPPNPGPGTGGGGPGGSNNGPALEGCTPTDGDTITAPTDLVCALIPRDGTIVDDWTLYLIPGGGAAEEAIPVGTGTGPHVTGEIDPTLLENGIWQVTVIADDDQGGRSQVESSIVVDGRFKVGRYTVTYEDLQVPVEGIPISIRRTYDTLDRRASTDFGHGWTLEVADVRVRANRQIGRGGWEQYDCGVALIIVTRCFRSHVPHFVSVTWPDGRVETFDATPAKSPPAFNFLTAVEYAGRPGTSSTLRPAPGDEFAMFIDTGDADGNLYEPFTTAPYDPTRFVLTTAQGDVLLLDVNDGLIEMRNPNGKELRINDDGIESSAGPAVSFHRDSRDRITDVVGPSGEHLQYRYDSATGDLTEQVDGEHRSTTFQYEDHLLVGTAGPGVPLRRIDYDDEGRVDTITVGDSSVTDVDIDVSGRTQTVVGPDPRLTSVDTFNEYGDVIRHVEVAEGVERTWIADYTPEGRPTYVREPGGEEEFTEYDALGNIVRHIDRSGVETRRTYGERSRPIDEYIAGEHVLHNEYDARGNLLSTGRPGGVPTLIDYDGSFRVASITDPEAGVTSFEYDVNGYADGVTGPTGSSSMVVNASGRPVEVVDSGGGRSFLAYDGDGRVARVTDPKGNSEQWLYDAAGNVVEYVDKAGHSIHYTYDTSGRRIARLDRNGELTTYGYDAAGRMTSVSTPDDITEVTYDAFGMRRQVRTAGQTIELSWDASGFPTSETFLSGGLSAMPPLQFDYVHEGGLLRSVAGPNATRSYGYDSRARLASLVDSEAGAFSFDYDAQGNLAEVGRPNGVVEALTYNENRQLRTSTVSLAGSELRRVDYAYDQRGLVDSITDGNGVHDYTYDARGQLTSADHPDGSGVADEAYSYDVNGNRSSWSGNPSHAVELDEADRLLSDATYLYSYDLEGNLIRREARADGATTEYDWNANHQLLEISHPDGSTTRFRYDGVGRRIEVASGTEVTRFVWQGLNLAATYDGAGQLLESYTTGLSYDSVLATRTATGTVAYPLVNGVGTVDATTDAEGNLVANPPADSFGRSGSEGSFTYAGLTRDASGLVYARHRYLDPDTGRFLSEDPFGGANAYPYAGNNPVSFVDPTGEAALPERATTQKPAVQSQPAIQCAGRQANGVLLQAIITLCLANVDIGGPYVRPSPGTRAFQRAAVSGLPCVDCGGAGEAADHIRPYVLEWLKGTLTGPALDIMDVQPQCGRCSSAQGGTLSHVSRKVYKGLDNMFCLMSSAL